MGKLNLTEHKTTYEDGQGRQPLKIKSGAYILLNVELTRKSVGENATPKVAVKTYVMAAYKPENKDAVASNFHHDLWANWTKAFNAQKLSHMIMAHGNDAMLENFDPDDDKELVAAITGVPYAGKVEVKSRRDGGKEYSDIELLEVKALNPAKRKELMDAPDFKKLAGLVEERMKQDEKGKSKKSRNSGSDDPRGYEEAPPPDDGWSGDPFADPELS